MKTKLLHVVHENVFIIFFVFAHIQMFHNFCGTMLNDFNICRSILIHYTTNKYLFVSTTPPTLSILQFNLPAAINRESSLEDTTFTIPSQWEYFTLNFLESVKKILKFQDAHSEISISCSVISKFFCLSFSWWFIRSFVCLFFLTFPSRSSTLII